MKKQYHINFVLSGILKVINTVWISYFLSCFLQCNIAFAAGSMISLLVDYMLKEGLYHEKKTAFIESVIYLIPYIPDFLIQNCTVLLLYNVGGGNRFTSYLLAAVIEMPAVFILGKAYECKKRENAWEFEKNLMSRLNAYPVFMHIGVFLFFIFLASLSKWSLLLGENLMKWDIWRAEYPNQVMMSDALEAHEIPLWNPLMHYGIPYYSAVGTPVFYPFTLILALAGYTPVTLAFSYVLHIAIGGFGMFLLASEEVRQENGSLTVSGFSAGIIAGILYSGCGVFLSNAEHIMIIISAAWVPHVFFFTRKFLKEKSMAHALMAGFCGSMVFWGYPEIFYNLFLFLFVYVLYFSYEKEKKPIANIWGAGSKFILICILTVLGSAVVLLPFLNNMSLITRGTGLGQVVKSYPLITLLSVLLSKMSLFVQGIERSMRNYYLGVIVILLIPMMIRKIDRKKIYAVLAVMGFLLCIGNNSFVHSLLYRFLPMYEDFRFPPLNRVFFVMFILLIAVTAFQDIMESRVDRKVLYITGALAGVLFLTAITSGFVGYLSNDTSTVNLEACKALSESAFTSVYLLLLYLGLFYAVLQKKIRGNYVPVCMVLAVIIEVMTFAHAEGPITITEYYPTDYSSNQEIKDKIDKEFEDNRNRVRSTNFASNLRSVNGTVSREIVFNKTFDEEGYSSYILSSTDDFKSTYMRSIMEENPEVYFTNDVIDRNHTSYEVWSGLCSNRPEQIYVEEEFERTDAETCRFDPQIDIEEELTLLFQNDQTIIRSTSLALRSTSTGTGRVRIYFEPENLSDSLYLELTFVDTEGGEAVYGGEYTVMQEEKGKYVDIFFPDIRTKYEEIRMVSLKAAPQKAQLVVTERMSGDNYTEVSRFSFNDIEMTVDAPTEGYVVILQAKHKGWTAFVDGKETEISLVDNCFMGLRVNPGRHEIVMRFRPKEFFAGAVITLLYMYALSIVWSINFSRKYWNPSEGEE